MNMIQMSRSKAIHFLWGNGAGCGDFSNVVTTDESVVTCKQCRYMAGRRFQRSVTLEHFPYLNTPAKGK